MGDQGKHEFGRMVPWGADEFVYVDGVPCVYTVDSDRNLRVHFPGGGHCRAVDMIERCIGPERPRLRDNATSAEHDSTRFTAKDMQP